MRASLFLSIKRGEIYTSLTKPAAVVEIDGVLKRTNDDSIMIVPIKPK